MSLPHALAVASGRQYYHDTATPSQVHRPLPTRVFARPSRTGAISANAPAAGVVTRHLACARSEASRVAQDSTGRKSRFRATVLSLTESLPPRRPPSSSVDRPFPSGSIVGIRAMRRTHRVSDFLSPRRGFPTRPTCRHRCLSSRQIDMPRQTVRG